MQNAHRRSIQDAEATATLTGVGPSHTRSGVQLGAFKKTLQGGATAPCSTVRPGPPRAEEDAFTAFLEMTRTEDSAAASHVPWPVPASRALSTSSVSPRPSHPPSVELRPDLALARRVDPQLDSRVAALHRVLPWVLGAVVMFALGGGVVAGY